MKKVGIALLAFGAFRMWQGRTQGLFGLSEMQDGAVFVAVGTLVVHLGDI